MKALVQTGFGSTEVLELQEIADPRPSHTGVVLKVAGCGICGHDQADRTGLTRVSTPVVLGHEISGEIVAKGAAVLGFQEGQRVAAKQFHSCGRCFACVVGRDVECSEDLRFGYGGAAEYAAVEQDRLLRIPDEVDTASASIIACAVGTCYQALTEPVHLSSHDWVLVTGASGGLGIHGLQVAAALGARTIALTSTAQKAEALRPFADEVVFAEPRYYETVRDITHGRGVNVVLDNVGHPDVFSGAFRSLSRQGTYVFTGQVYRERVSFFPAFLLQGKVLTGSSSTTMGNFMKSMKLVDDGAVRCITTSYPLAEGAAAHRSMDDRELVGRAVLCP